jgi:hypothetical protein
MQIGWRTKKKKRGKRGELTAGSGEDVVGSCGSVVVVGGVPAACELGEGAHGVRRDAGRALVVAARAMEDWDGGVLRLEAARARQPRREIGGDWRRGGGGCVGEKDAGFWGYL